MTPPAPAGGSRAFDAARAVLAAALFTYPATMLTVPAVPGAAIAVLLIGSLATLPFTYARRAELARPADYAPVLGLALFLVAGTAGALAWHAPRWDAISHFRLLAALALVGAIRLLRPPAWALYAGCSAGALGAGVHAAVQCFGFGFERASGPDIYFGWQLATIFGLLSIVLGLLPLFAGTHGWPPIARWLRVAGVVGGVTAGALSGSRGAWVAGSVLLLWWIARAHRRALLPSLALLLLAWVALPYPAQRWNAALSDLMGYEQHRAQSALGLRLDMWDAAIGSFLQHPWFGVGPQGFRHVLVSRTEEGLAAAAITEYWHAHNELLNALAAGGIVLGLALVAAYWLPWRHFRRVDLRERGPALSGAALVLAFVLFGLSDSVFVHRVSLTAYVVLAAAFVGFSATADGEAPAGRGGDPVPAPRSGRRAGA